MQCPVCTETMRRIDRQELRMDVCPKCRGGWLEERDLERILALMTNERAGYGFRDDNPDRRDHDRHEHHERHRQHDSDDDYHGYHGHSSGRRRGLLGRLFEFLD